MLLLLMTPSSCEAFHLLMYRCLTSYGRCADQADKTWLGIILHFHCCFLHNHNHLDALSASSSRAVSGRWFSSLFQLLPAVPMLSMLTDEEILWCPFQIADSRSSTSCLCTHLLTAGTLTHPLLSFMRIFFFCLPGYCQFQ